MRLYHFCHHCSDQIKRIQREARTKNGHWNLPDMLRGEVAHALGGENMPYGFEGIDKVVLGANRKPIEVTSIKSIQPYAKSYREPGALYNKLRADIDALAKPNRFGRGLRQIVMTPTTRRILAVEVPPNTLGPEMTGRPRGDPALREQWRKEAAAAIDYARTMNVELRFKAVQP